MSLMILERDSFARLWGPGRGGGGADPTRDSLLGPAHARWRTQGDELLAGARNLDVGSIWSPASSVEAGEVAEVMEILNAATWFAAACRPAAAGSGSDGRPRLRLSLLSPGT
jgi:hypothetical protein